MRNYHSYPLYETWKSMVARCCKPNHPAYHYYGGRGIDVCDEWRFDFFRFMSDLPPKPSGRHSLDRIDNDGNYEPTNVRWATHQQQMDNARKPNTA